MLIKSQPEITRNTKGYVVTFQVDEDEADNLYALANAIQPDKEYELLIRKRPKKRTTDANAYAWKLISLISAEIGLSPIEVYQQQILDMYSYRDVLIKDSDLNREISDWRQQGIGWLCEVVGPSPLHEGYTWLRKYRGSSSFTTSEMSRFIDNIIFEAKELGIQTESPSRINALKQEWKHADNRRNE